MDTNANVNVGVRYVCSHNVESVENSVKGCADYNALSPQLQRSTLKIDTNHKHKCVLCVCFFRMLRNTSCCVRILTPVRALCAYEYLITPYFANGSEKVKNFWAKLYFCNFKLQ